MKLDLITKLAKQPNQSYLRTLLSKPRSPQTPQIHVLPKAMYSSSPHLPEKKGLIQWYLRMLEVRPIFTKAVSSSLIYAAADVTSQMITMPPSGSIDFVRTTRIASFGLFILGPSQHFWFSFVANALPKRDVVSTLKKIVMGQLIFGPIINSIFFSYNAGLQGENGHQIIARLKRDLLPTLMGGLMYWPLCDFLTFKIIPVGLQPLINSSFAYLWSIYLTYMAGLEKAE
ncbi:transporter [Lithospermum erythrorhizon]|uniref:Transporter n=1 Tax=Lithospermum erythrorhizon TaxID=34254 RepID=A0AAV3QCJ7_LITER